MIYWSAVFYVLGMLWMTVLLGDVLVDAWLATEWRKVRLLTTLCCVAVWPVTIVGSLVFAVVQGIREIVALVRRLR